MIHSQTTNSTSRILFMLVLIGSLLGSFNTALGQCPGDPSLRISSNLQSFTCTQVPVIFKNESNFPLDSVKSFEWNFGDGSVILGSPSNNSQHWGDANGDIPQHFYKQDGLYDLRFRVELLNGFKDTVYRNMLVRSSMKIRQLNTLSGCGPDTIGFELDIFTEGLKVTNTRPLNRIKWHNLPGRTDRLYQFQVIMEGYNNPNHKKIYVTHEDTRYQNCPNFSDSLDFVGSLVKSEIENLQLKLNPAQKFQCDAFDTVFFTNTSFYPSNNKVNRLWEFGDTYADQCTTDTRNGLNAGKNCNYSRDSLPKHKYKLIDSIYLQDYYSKNVPILQGQVTSNGTYSKEFLDTNDGSSYRDLFDRLIVKPYMVILKHQTQSGCTSEDTVLIQIGPSNASLFGLEQVIDHPYTDHNLVLSLDRELHGYKYQGYLYSFDSFSHAKPRWNSTVNDKSNLHPGESVGIYQSFHNQMPDKVYIEYDRKYVDRGDDHIYFTLIAHQGYASGKYMCPDTARIKINTFIHDPTFSLDVLGKDSIQVQLKDERRPQSWSLDRFVPGFSARTETISEWLPNTTGSNHKYQTILEQFSGSKIDTVITSTYNLAEGLNISKLSPNVLRHLVNYGIDVKHVDVDHMFKSFGDNTSGKIDTTGFGLMILKAVDRRKTSLTVLDQRDSVIVGNGGPGMFKLKDTSMRNAQVLGLKDNWSESLSLTHDALYLKSKTTFWPWESALSWYPQRHGIYFRDYGGKSYFPDLYHRKGYPSLSDTLKPKIQVFYLDTLNMRLFEQGINQDLANGSYNIYATQTLVKHNGKDTKVGYENLTKEAGNWIHYLKPGADEKIWIDWDINDQSRALDSSFTMDDDHLVFSYIPMKEGDFEGSITTQASNGEMSVSSFRYRGFAIEEPILKENISENWIIKNDCDHLLELTNTSFVTVLDKCGNPLPTLDTLISIVYDWGDGDQTTAKPGDQVSHSYAGGTYVLSINYHTKFNYKLETKKTYVVQNLIPDIDFDYSVNSDTIHLFGPQLGDSLSVLWTFGDGNSSSELNPTHFYTQNKTYNVCLTVRNDSNKCKLNLCRTINPYGCDALFEAVKDTFNKFGVWVVDQSTGNNLSYIWDFGDGDSSHNQYPTHIYADFGKYLLCLEVRNSNCKSEYCDSIGMDSDGKLLKKVGFEINVVHPDKLGLDPLQGHTGSVHVYPNPAHDIINIESSLSNPIEFVRVIDLSGKLVLDNRPNSHTSSINISKLEIGLYVLQVIDKTGTFNFRLLVD